MTASGFLEKLAEGINLVSDGATGTNLQKMGLPVGAPGEVWVLENPEAIGSLNIAFIEAGADIILTCTFGGTRLRLAAADLAGEFETINRRAVGISREAVAGTDVLVGGSIGPIGQMLEPLGTLTAAEAQKEYADQARILCDSGVDLIVVETQFDLNEASAAVRGVRSVDPGIPLVCSFSYDRGTRTMMGVTPEAMADTFNLPNVDVLGINCGRSLVENFEVLQTLRKVTEKPIWFKPNAGLPETNEDGEPVYSVKPKEMGALVPQWLEAGAKIVGGCCGTSPEHLAEIAQAVKG